MPTLKLSDKIHFFSIKKHFNAAETLIVDSHDSTSVEGLKYVFIFSGNSGNHTLEYLVTHDGTDTYTTTFGELFTSVERLITITSDINAGKLEIHISSAEAGYLRGSVVKIG